MAKTSGTKTSGGKKEKVFHPQSRKAGQLVRTQIRKSRLVELSKERHKKQGSQSEYEIIASLSCDADTLTVSIYSFFYHALPPEGELSLEELHFVVREIWLARFDSEIEAEKAARRKGRPRSMKEQKLEEQKLRETELYRTGMGESFSLPALHQLVNTFMQRSSTSHIRSTWNSFANGTSRKRRTCSNYVSSGFPAHLPRPSYLRDPVSILS